MLRKIKRKVLFLAGAMVASVFGVYLGSSFSKFSSPLIDIDTVSADVPASSDSSSADSSSSDSSSADSSSSDSSSADSSGSADSADCSDY